MQKPCMCKHRYENRRFPTAKQRAEQSSLHYFVVILHQRMIVSKLQRPMLNSYPVRRAVTAIAVAALVMVVFSLVGPAYERVANYNTKKFDQSRLTAGWLNIAFVGATSDHRASTIRHTTVNYEILTRRKLSDVSPTIDDTMASTTVPTTTHHSKPPSTSPSIRPTPAPVTEAPSTLPTAKVFHCIYVHFVVKIGTRPHLYLLLHSKLKRTARLQRQPQQNQLLRTRIR